VDTNTAETSIPDGDSITFLISPSSSSSSPRPENVMLLSSSETKITEHEPSHIMLSNPPTSPQKSIDNKLKSVLLSSNEGKSLLYLYEDKGLLDFSGRKRLCHLIINNELRDNPNVRVTSEKLAQLAKEITEIFPRENENTYYVPYARLGATEKRHAKGKLLDCLTNKRRELRKQGILPRPQGKENKTSQGEDPLENVSKEKLDEEEFKEDLTWLHNSCDPWHIVQTKWSHTTRIRVQKLLNCEQSVGNYLTEFPALQKPEGYLLVSSNNTCRYRY